MRAEALDIGARGLSAEHFRVPTAQGKGFGGAAIRARLALCDAQGLPAALETATESNVGLYQALGFAVTGTYRITGGPMFWSMWRDPRG